MAGDGQVSALALDPLTRPAIASTGNDWGGVWRAQNAGTASASSIVFTPLTDSVAALSGAEDASITSGIDRAAGHGLELRCGIERRGVILAGTGDPNDALDSITEREFCAYRRGNTWSLIATTSDFEQNLSKFDFSFAGEGFAGLHGARSIRNWWWPRSRRHLKDAGGRVLPGELRGSVLLSDAGASWHIATITDEEGADVQGRAMPLRIPTAMPQPRCLEPGAPAI